MSKLIIVCGLGGAGKTTIAKALSKELNIVCLHKDSIKAAIYDELDILTPDSFKVLFNLVEEQLSNDIDLIIEAPFNHDEDIALFEKWAKEYTLNIYSIICQIDDKTRIERTKKRPRHTCHAKADKANIGNPEVESFDYSTMPGQKIFITTDVPLEESINKILKELQ